MWIIIIIAILQASALLYFNLNTDDYQIIYTNPYGCEIIVLGFVIALAVGLIRRTKAYKEAAATNPFVPVSFFFIYTCCVIISTSPLRNMIGAWLKFKTLAPFALMEKIYSDDTFTLMRTWNVEDKLEAIKFAITKFSYSLPEAKARIVLGSQDLIAQKLLKLPGDEIAKNIEYVINGFANIAMESQQRLAPIPATSKSYMSRIGASFGDPLGFICDNAATIGIGVVSIVGICFGGRAAWNWWNKSSSEEASTHIQAAHNVMDLGHMMFGAFKKIGNFGARLTFRTQAQNQSLHHLGNAQAAQTDAKFEKYIEIVDALTDRVTLQEDVGVVLYDATDWLTRCVNHLSAKTGIELPPFDYGEHKSND